MHSSIKFLLFLAYGFNQLSSCLSDPLFLTPLIEAGEIKAAQRRAKVTPFLPSVKSYSGYLTVDKQLNSNIFFWFFPKTSKWRKAPLILWFNGGPGVTSLLGLFCQNGPYAFARGKLQPRPHSWTNFYNLLYVDVPVGTGFSFADSPAGYSTNRTEVADHLVQVLSQFRRLFPPTRRNELILAGESYAGTYLSRLAYVSRQTELNVSRIFLCSPPLSLQDMLPHFSSYLQAHGLLDAHGHAELRHQELLVLQHIRARRWADARDLYFQLFAANGSLVQRLTGSAGTKNLLRFENGSANLPPRFQRFLNENRTRSALHVRHRPFTASARGVRLRQTDFMQSVKNEFASALESFKTLVMHGQFDLLTPYPLHTRTSASLDWSGNWDYVRADRRPFRWRRHLCGYYKVAKTYTEVLVRNAGHLLAEDQPQCVLALLRAFIGGDFD